MKKILSLATLACIGFAAASFTSKPVNDNEQTATVIIYRQGQFNAAAANWAMFADGEKICKLSNNKFIKHEVKPGKHVYSAKVGGVGVFKKETEVEINAEPGQVYYIACNVKTSFTRSRLELMEVTKGTGEKQMANMKMDNCQEDIEETAGSSK